MAVVVSQSQNESRGLQEKGLDIVPHRKRMVKEDLETKFKDPDRPVPHRVCLCHVDDRLRCALLLHHLPRQADEEPHPDADHCQGEPGTSRRRTTG